MKFKYFLTAALLASLSVGISSCSDDEEEVAPIAPSKELTLPTETQMVKIGTENRVPLPVVDGNGSYNAYSLNPEIADITYDDNGAPYIEGFVNGIARIVVSDADNQYKSLTVMSYTTDELKLSHSDYTFVITLGMNGSSDECHVTLGNGGYSITSSSPNVSASIDSESGEITISSKSTSEDFTSVLTVTDVCGLTATINVTVKASFEPFTDSELQEILAKEKSSVEYNNREPYMFDDIFYGYGEISTTTEDGITTTGWYYNDYGYLNSFRLVYPEGTPINTEIDGNLLYANDQRKITTYTGKIKILADNAEKFVGVWYKIDLEAEKIDRGYIVWIK